VRNTTGDNILIDDVEMTGGSGPITLSAEFKADKTVAGVGTTIHFTDLSIGSPIAWEWEITGPETKTSNEQNPSFTFTKAGSYDVKLTVSNDDESAEEIKADYINIGDFILFQDFNSGAFGDWETISVVGEQKWVINNTGGPDGSPCAQMNGYAGGNNPNEDWLVSPVISATSFVLTFDNAKNFVGDDLKLMVSTNYSGNVGAATWSQLNYRASSGDYSWTNSEEVKYTPQGGKAHIAFKYTSTASDGALWRVDNIVVKKGGSQSITENPSIAVNIYPNPSSTGIFNIKAEGNATVKAFSTDGRLIQSQIMTGEATLDLSTCSQGIYFIQIQTENGIATQKVVKQ
jgi:PKD repeat protein